MTISYLKNQLGVIGADASIDIMYIVHTYIIHKGLTSVCLSFLIVESHIMNRLKLLEINNIFHIHSILIQFYVNDC